MRIRTNQKLSHNKQPTLRGQLDDLLHPRAQVEEEKDSPCHKHNIDKHESSPPIHPNQGIKCLDRLRRQYDDVGPSNNIIAESSGNSLEQLQGVNISPSLPNQVQNQSNKNGGHQFSNNGSNTLSNNKIVSTIMDLGAGEAPSQQVIAKKRRGRPRKNQITEEQSLLSSQSSVLVQAQKLNLKHNIPLLKNIQKHQEAPLNQVQQNPVIKTAASSTDKQDTEDNVLISKEPLQSSDSSESINEEPSSEQPKPLAIMVQLADIAGQPERAAIEKESSGSLGIAQKIEQAQQLARQPNSGGNIKEIKITDFTSQTVLHFPPQISSSANIAGNDDKMSGFEDKREPLLKQTFPAYDEKHYGQYNIDEYNDKKFLDKISSTKKRIRDGQYDFGGVLSPLENSQNDISLIMGGPNARNGGGFDGFDNYYGSSNNQGNFQLNHNNTPVMNRSRSNSNLFHLAQTNFGQNTDNGRLGNLGPSHEAPLNSIQSLNYNNPNPMTLISPRPSNTSLLSERPSYSSQVDNGVTSSNKYFHYDEAFRNNSHFSSELRGQSNYEQQSMISPRLPPSFQNPLNKDNLGDIIPNTER